MCCILPSAQYVYINMIKVKIMFIIKSDYNNKPCSNDYTIAMIIIAIKLIHRSLYTRVRTTHSDVRFYFFFIAVL